MGNLKIPGLVGLVIFACLFIQCENKPSERKIKLSTTQVGDSLRLEDSSVTILKIEPAQRRSVAVMYFKNQTGDENLDWMQRGIAEMLVTSLSQSRYLDVLPLEQLYSMLRKLGETETSAFDIRFATALGQRARVESIILGKLIKKQNDIVVETQLISTNTGDIIGTETVSGQLENSFTMIDELSKKVKSEISIQTPDLPESEISLIQVTTNSLRAYEDYNKGQWHSERIENDLALQYFEKAVEADPTFAMAYAKLSDECLIAGDDLRAAKYIKKAVEFIDRATPIDQEYIRGAKAIYDLDYATAVSKLNRVINADSNRIDAYIRLAGVFLEQQQLAVAEKLIKRAESKNEFLPMIQILFAQLYISTGRFSEVRQRLDNANQLNPNTALSKAIVGVLHLLDGENREAIVSFREALEMQPNNISALVNLGLLYTDTEGNTQAAITLFENALKLSPNSSTILRVLGFVYIEAGRYEDAIKVFEDASKLHNRLRPHALLGLGVVHLRLKNFSKARSYFDEFLITYPDSITAHCPVAGAFNDEEMFSQARSEVELALKTRPDLLCALNVLRQILANQGHHSQAIEILEKIIATSPNSTNYRNNLGWQLIEQERFAEAQKLAYESIDKEPQNLGTLSQIRWLSDQVGDEDSVVKLTKQLNDRIPKFDRACLWQGQAFLNLHQNDDAKLAFNKYLSMASDSLIAIRNIANAYIESGQTDYGLSLLKDVVERRPNAVWTHQNYADALMGDGQFEEAIRELRAALKINSNAMEVIGKLGHACRMAGNFDESVDFYEEYQNRNLSNTRKARAEKWIAMRCSETGEYRRALKHLKKAVDYARKDDNIRQIKEFRHAEACLYRESGAPEKAVTIYLDLLKLDENEDWIRANLAVTFLEMNKVNETHHEMNKISQRINSGTSPLRKRLIHEIRAEQFLKQGNPDSALAYIHKAFKTRKNGRHFYYQLMARAHFMKNQYDSTQIYCHKFIKTNAEDFFMVYLRPRMELLAASCLAKEGQLEQAIAATRRVAKCFEDADSNVKIARMADEQLEQLLNQRKTGD